MIIHPITFDGIAPSIQVVCGECGTLAIASTDRSADIVVAQHDARWS